MKKKSTIIALALLVSGALYYYFGVYNSISIDEAMGDTVESTSLDVNEVDKKSEVIIVGSTNQNLEDRKPYGKDSSEFDWISITEVKVHKVFKGSQILKGNTTINIIEQARTTQTLLGKKMRVFESYRPLEKDKKYILFLGKYENGEYRIKNNGLGMVDLSYKKVKPNIEKIDCNPKTIHVAKVHMPISEIGYKFMKDVFEKYPTE